MRPYGTAAAGDSGVAMGGGLVWQWESDGQLSNP